MFVFKLWGARNWRGVGNASTGANSTTSGSGFAICAQRVNNFKSREMGKNLTEVGRKGLSCGVVGPLGVLSRGPAVMPDAPKAEKFFNSTFPMKVDDKRRVQIPAKWRPEEAGAELTVVPWETAHGMSLRVFPQTQFLKMIEKIESMPDGSVERDELLRKVGRNSEQVTIDSAGRITLPDAMMKVAGLSIQAPVVLVGVVRVFEIWNPERFAASEASTALGPANYRFIG